MTTDPATPNDDAQRIAQAKAELRAQVMRRRAALTPQAREAAEERIAQRIDALLAERRLAEDPGPIGVLAGYAASGDEAAIDGLMRELIAEGRPVALPRVSGPGRLAFHQVVDLAVDLAPGAFGIREPSAASPAIDPADLDVVLVPGVAFDASGGRVGQGLGFYDRLLTRTRAMAIGVCFDLQVLDEVPMTAHDVRLDAVVTEAAVYR